MVSPPRRLPPIFLPLLTALLLGADAAWATPVTLPQTVPVPYVHPPAAGNLPPQRLGEVPVPEPRPDNKTPEEPAPPSDQADEKKPPAPPDPRSNAPRAATMPAAEKACRARLRTLGVEFTEHPPEKDAAGCALPWPIAVKALGDKIGIKPDALMNCALAETAARFAQDVVSPDAKSTYGAGLKSISQASTYVCRPRNGSAKLSEHAFGNALDIAQFTLTDNTAIDVGPTPDEKTAKFLARLRKAACGPFKTVLGPGSDADHERHFHLDLAPRRNGGTFCQ
ncbi:extensin family protein [Pseudaminobacter arsenicus]|uniref:Extensin family protein n=1 Tax=Borborobacter arsenicus TaxID=1851146 RepID=A0A432V3W6_9HYPH|nr:extensin family protein [Pseudaminobacter arsenicus]RUM96933.1 extensin family protein [Pseudaminobacter arsenicus]